MYAAERQRIMREAREAGRVEVVLLAEQLGVATETIRRDPDRARAPRHASAVHGGAIPVGAWNLSRPSRRGPEG